MLPQRDAVEAIPHTSERGPEFIANETEDFLERWGVKMRDSAAYNPQSNGRAELAVKSTKRLLEENIGSDGNLNTDEFIQAMLIYRNTPDPFCHLLRDTMPRLDKTVNIFFNPVCRPEW